MSVRKASTPTGLCPVCGRVVGLLSDGYIGGGKAHCNPATGFRCHGHGRKANPRNEES